MTVNCSDCGTVEFCTCQPPITIARLEHIDEKCEACSHRIQEFQAIVIYEDAITHWQCPE